MDFNEKEGKTSFFYANKKYLFVVVFIIVLFCVIIYAVLIHGSVKTCGDGTSKGFCSERKPYFCSSEGVLVEKATVCGCNGNLTVLSDSCISKYQTEPENIILKYTLNGKEGEINYMLYKGMINYISKLPSEINYKANETPDRGDFILRDINEPEQRELLLPLVTKIQNLAPESMEDQARIAISISQNLKWGPSNRTIKLRHNVVNYSRYPYEVLYDSQGLCGEKSELLAFLLKEVGYNVSVFYYSQENHEAIGIKCPEEFSVSGTGYCFVETTASSIITDNGIEYSGGLKISSEPEIIPLSGGESLPEDMDEYRDAETWMKVRRDLDSDGRLNPVNYLRLKSLSKKYGLDLYREYNIG